MKQILNLQAQEFGIANPEQQNPEKTIFGIQNSSFNTNNSKHSPTTDKNPPTTDFLFTLVPKLYIFAM